MSHENPFAGFITTDEAIKTADISKPTLRLWVRRGMIPKPVKYGHKHLYPRDDFRAALERILKPGGAAV